MVLIFFQKNILLHILPILPIKAAQFQNEKLANKFLRRIREAAASEAKKVNQMGILIELAQRIRT